MNDTPTRLVTIDYFIKEMMGWKTLSSYYSHIDDEGWPQRVYPNTKKPMLVLSECQAYIDGLMANREKPVAKFKRAKAGEGVRADQKPRHRGRPAKVLRPPEGGSQGADNGST